MVRVVHVAPKSSENAIRTRASSQTVPNGRNRHSSHTAKTRGAPFTSLTVVFGTDAMRKLFAFSSPPNGSGWLIRATCRVGPNVVLPGWATRSSRTNFWGFPESSPRTCTHETYVRPSGPIVGSLNWMSFSLPDSFTGAEQLLRSASHRDAMIDAVKATFGFVKLKSDHVTHTCSPSPVLPTEIHSLSRKSP